MNILWQLFWNFFLCRFPIFAFSFFTQPTTRAFLSDRSHISLNRKPFRQKEEFFQAFRFKISSCSSSGNLRRWKSRPSHQVVVPWPFFLKFSSNDFRLTHFFFLLVFSLWIHIFSREEWPTRSRETERQLFRTKSVWIVVRRRWIPVRGALNDCAFP